MEEKRYRHIFFEHETLKVKDDITEKEFRAAFEAYYSRWYKLYGSMNVYQKALIRWLDAPGNAAEIEAELADYYLDEKDDFDWLPETQKRSINFPVPKWGQSIELSKGQELLMEMGVNLYTDMGWGLAAFRLMQGVKRKDIFEKANLFEIESWRPEFTIALDDVPDWQPEWLKSEEDKYHGIGAKQRR